MADAAAAVKREMSILRRMQLAFGSLLLMLTLACLAFFWSQRMTAAARDWTSHSYQVLLDLDALKQSFADQRLAIRDYLIGEAQRVELKSYHAGVEAFEHRLEALRTLTADNPLEQSRLQELQLLMAQWHTQIADVELRLAADAATHDQAVAMLSSADNLALLDRIHGAIHAMDQTERDLLLQRQQTLDQTMAWVRSGTLALLVLGLLAGLAALRLTARGVIRPIIEMTGLMTRLAQDDHAILVPYRQRGDEIGDIARALQVFKQMAIDTYARNWVKSQLTEISGALQAASGLLEFGRTVVGRTAPLCAASVGLFLARRDDGNDGSEFEVIGRYGCDGQISAAGRGLVEQCAEEALPIVLDDIPEGYLNVKSALGAAPPRQLLLLPAMIQGRVIGVLEMAAFAPVAAMPRALLDELMPIVALSLENLQRAVHTHELLETSVAQTEALRLSEEALRSQQEELRATNDELQSKSQLLQEQAQRLRASEEELRVQAEELEASNEELRQTGTTLNQQHEALAVLQRETLDKADALARASQYKSEFLANMSHELRTPLNSLLILSKSLADNEGGRLDAEEVESARIIHESGGNLLRLINDILDLSKVEAGKMELLRDALPLRNFAVRLQRTFGHVARGKQLAFDVSVADDLPETLNTDGARLEQVLNNLLGNAFKFTREGQVSLRIARADAADAQRVGLASRPAVAFVVSDSGVGIPADKFEQVFRAFEQVDGTTSRQFGGTGLGLSIARSMTRMLGGDILLHSEPGRGSTFTVLLPLDGDAAAAPAPAPPAAPTAAVLPPRAAAEFKVVDDRGRLAAADAPSGTVILAIEDDPVFAGVLVDMIRRKGFLALAAGDGERGLALAKQYRPTGILLDVMLPVMDGWSVLDRLKTDPETRHIPVHFISATEDVARGLELGAVGFLTKPVTREALGEAFDRLLHFAQGAPRRVLVVDDDDGSRAAVRSLVAGADVEVMEAGSGEAALQQMSDQTFDCLILDLGLPGISGFEFLDQAAQRGPVPPVVVYSGRELTREENLRLRQYTDSIVIKGARSPERLLDEVSLFLHSIRAGQPSAPNAAQHQPEPTLVGHTVLIVDDDMRNIFALSKVLRAKGLQVVMAQDGHKALRQLDENTRIELVLMDIMMPGMDGYQTMREIRRQPRLQRLPIIALTAKAMQGDREKCLDAGANDYLSKPVDVDKLLSMMRVYLRGG